MNEDVSEANLIDFRHTLIFCESLQSHHLWLDGLFSSFFDNKSPFLVTRTIILAFASHFFEKNLQNPRKTPIFAPTFRGFVSLWDYKRYNNVAYPEIRQCGLFYY